MTGTRFIAAAAPAPTPDRDDWRDSARCRDLLPETWFPDKGHTEDARDAKAICAACDVRNACLEWALTYPEEFGVWGALTADERKELRKRRAS